MGPMFGYTLVSILCPFVNLKGSCFGLITGQAVNIWLSGGSMVYGVGTPTLELKTTDCSMFNLTMEEIPEPALSNVTNVPIHLLDRPFEYGDIYRMSYNVYPIIGMVLTIVLSIIGSLATGGFDDIRAEDKDLVHPWAWKLFGRDKPYKEEYVLKDKEDECAKKKLDKA